MITKSETLFEQAKKSIPGGVNSPVRSFQSVGGKPIFMESAKGAYLNDVDGKSYIDYINSWGPMILGHNHPEVLEAIQVQAQKALGFGAPTELEVKMAELIRSIVPNVDLLRLVSSGTEACMTAIRVARGFTNRNKFIKLEGCYHGHADPFLVKAGSGLATLGIQSQPGITSGASKDTLVAPFNDLDSIQKIFQDNKDEIAAIILEPVAGNMGCIPPNAGYLEGLRKICTENKSLLIFDEVMTGFRLSLGGAQELFGIEADLITMGKIIGGGLPVAAFGGKREIMETVAPIGKVYQAGTLSGNPVAVSAGFKTLSILKENPEIYRTIERTTRTLHEGAKSILTKKGIPHKINSIGSMISIFFGTEKISNFQDVANSDINMFNRFFHFLLEQGIYLPPSAYESWFISNAITDTEIDKTLVAMEKF
ncbi:MAG: glutamate-1-semialdehyde 2,1-aminomutase [Leptospiraceae bacterium]|nr:glutamate-1-semialdehyde 2,1-aminomutase [Leptospiraceae bacterium]